ncbi:MAG: chemotaxis protein CheW [Pseudomonadota bacterium]
MLGQVHRLDNDLTPLVGRPDWFMGLLRVGERTIRVTDTARWVMPERYRDSFRDGYRFVIQLGDSAWGLACDEVAQSFRVEPEEVKWRSEGGRRQWLAGTIKKEMCALLDVSRMAVLLQKAETERNPDLDR